MVTSKLCRFGLGILGALALGAVLLPAAPAKADSFAFGYSSGYPGPRHYHGPYRGHGYRTGFVYVAPPPVYYAPPPRVVYVNPPPAYYAPPPVVYQAPQTLPGGPLASDQSQQCREYQSTAVVNGQRVPSYGTACLQPDGSWRIVR
jgi:hypothetical protein